MTTQRRRAAAELVLACAAVLGCVLAGSRVRRDVLVAPIIDGEPVTTSVTYDPQLLLLALLLAAAAGVLAVVGTARLVRARRIPAATEPAAPGVSTTVPEYPRGV